MTILTSLAALLLALGPGANPAKLEELTRSLHSPDQGVRIRALAKLGQMGPAAAPAAGDVIALLLDPAVRADALTLHATVAALGDMGGAAKSAIPALRLLVQDSDVDSASRGEAVVALSKIQLQDPDPSVRLRAARRLAESSPSAIPALQRSLNDEDAAVREAVRAAIEMLEPMKDAKPTKK